ncbi:MAG TPA: MXAN_2562 family outer membrane beta-barrel protein [Nitrospirota bacterium]|nr:MXAN_2562 family outer membrane beta-barrel protein [Nitrospirota bacterium]
MKKSILILLFSFFPVVVFAAGSDQERPHWSLEIKGGRFYPDISNWSTYYGKDYTGEYAGSLAYKITRQIEVGIQGGYIKDNGEALAPLHGITAGSVTYELAPVNAFVLVRGVFSEKQLLVPYIGGGWTRIYYKEELQSQSTARGTADGYHGRGGLQMLLDRIDQSASTSLYEDIGVFHTYLFVEVEYTHAMANTNTGGSVNLGGSSWLAGLLFEF